MRFLSITLQSTIYVTFMTMPVLATDLGTYRPGSPYHSVNAAGADICASHCSGDAQCRGWNFVKVNPRAPGVCEFNAKWAAPITSVISISGDGAPEPTRGLMQGGTNTVRVGTSARLTTRTAPNRAPQSRQVVNQAQPPRTAPRTRIVREPVPQNRVIPRQAVNRTAIKPATGNTGMSLTEQQNRRRAQQGRQVQPQPQSQPQPQLQPQPHSRANAPSPNANPRLLRDPRIAGPVSSQPGFRHSLDGGRQMQNRQPMNNASQQRQLTAPQNRQMRAVPPQYGHQPYPAQMQRSSVNAPVTMRNSQPGAQSHRAPVQSTAPQAYRPGLNSAQAQQSLFGRLNDDVRAPKPLTRVPVDPNAPIQTMEARPTQPIIQEPLNGLAGAR